MNEPEDKIRVTKLKNFHMAEASYHGENYKVVKTRTSRGYSSLSIIHMTDNGHKILVKIESSPEDDTLDQRIDELIHLLNRIVDDPVKLPGEK